MESWRVAAHLLLIMLPAVTGVAQETLSHPPSQPTGRTRVVLLGTGTPVPDPDRSGPATAIVVDDNAYLVDFGPGVIRRAESAALSRRMPAVGPGNLKVAFVTHLHSDHTAGYSDLIFTGWTSGRKVPLEVYGPSGLPIDDRAHFAGLSRRYRDTHQC
jgi:ribonuclease BN (tRNA processing enzyme)